MQRASFEKTTMVCIDDVTTPERQSCVNKARARALLRNIWKKFRYFWWLEERSCDGVWSPNRGSSLLLGKRGTERRRRVGGGGMVERRRPVTLQPLYDLLLD